MSGELIESREERIRLVREKAEREGLGTPEDVIEYVADKAVSKQRLKGALIQVHTVALARGALVDLAFARSVLGGAEECDGDDMEAAEPTGLSFGELSDESAEVVEEAPEAWGQEPADLEAPEAEPALFATHAPPPTGTAASPSGAAAAGTGGVVIRPSVVWFAPMRTQRKDSLVGRAGRILQRAGLADAISEGDLVAVKLHFGETGNTGFVNPVFVREVVRLIKEAGGRPFLTDANTLYRGSRGNAVDHVACAIRNGFSFATVEAPIVIADGLDGREAVSVRIEGGTHFEDVRIGSAAVHADAMVVVTHVKGHEATGFGGALKNVGMGLGCRSAKQRMHADFRPEVRSEKCTACGRCVKWCPVDAVSIGPDRVARIDHDACYGCGECVAACPEAAIATQWETTPEAIQEKIVEHVAGVLQGKRGKVVYLSFLTDISPDCDCWHFSDAGVVPDIGVLASDDIVAIERAAYDLVVQAPGVRGTRGQDMVPGDDKFALISGVDGTHAIRYAESMGLGTSRYDMRTLD